MKTRTGAIVVVPEIDGEVAVGVIDEQHAVRLENPHRFSQEAAAHFFLSRKRLDLVVRRTLLVHADVLEHSATKDDVEEAVRKWERGCAGGDQMHARHRGALGPLIDSECSVIDAESLEPGVGEIFGTGSVATAAIEQ